MTVARVGVAMTADLGVAKKRSQKRGDKKRWCRGEWQKRGGKKEVAKKR